MDLGKTLVAVIGLLLCVTADSVAQTRPSTDGFIASRRMFLGLFGVPARAQLRPPALPMPAPAARQFAANRHCLGCPGRPGRMHFVIDSPRLDDEWLANHQYQSNGGSFGDNAAVADFWYDAVHRRIMSRSAAFHEVDDPADIRLGRAPGTYPGEPDFAQLLPEGTTVGQVGFESWTNNGYGAYFAAIQGAVRDVQTGYLDLTTATGASGRTRATGSLYDPEDLIRHVRLHPDGRFEVGYETDPVALPDPLMIVRGRQHVQYGLTVGGITRMQGGATIQGDATIEGTATVQGPVTIQGPVVLQGPVSIRTTGGNVLHACVVTTNTVRGRSLSARCDVGQIALSGGGVCRSGDLKGSRPVIFDEGVSGWELTCGGEATHTVSVTCCSQ
jgi:hypothetical protein